MKLNKKPDNLERNGNDRFIKKQPQNFEYEKSFPWCCIFHQYSIKTSWEYLSQENEVIW